MTLSAQKDLISLARKRAQQLDCTLNDAFREWLVQFTKPLSSRSDYEALMKSMNWVMVGSGAKFSRDVANER